MVADNSTAPAAASEGAADNGADWRSQQERRIYRAAGFMPGDLDESTRSVVTWLAGWDEHTVNAVVKLLSGGWEDLAAERASVSAPDDSEGAQR